MSTRAKALLWTIDRLAAEDRVCAVVMLRSGKIDSNAIRGSDAMKWLHDIDAAAAMSSRWNTADLLITHDDREALRLFRDGDKTLAVVLHLGGPLGKSLPRIARNLLARYNPTPATTGEAAAA